MTDNITFTHEDYAIIEAEDNKYIKLTFSKNEEGIDRIVSYTYNSKQLTSEFLHDDIVVRRCSAFGELSEEKFNELRAEITNLRDQISLTLENYLSRDSFFEYINNNNGIAQYIKYITSKDILHTTKSFASTKSFIMFRDFSSEDELYDYGNSSSGILSSWGDILDRPRFGEEYVPVDYDLDSRYYTRDLIDDKLSTLTGVDIPDWALEPNKPSYTALEIGALPTAGGTMSGAIRWVTRNNKTPFIGQYASDGTLVISITGETSATGIAIGGTSGNLLYNSNKVWHAGNSNLSIVDWTASALAVHDRTDFYSSVYLYDEWIIGVSGAGLIKMDADANTHIGAWTPSATVNIRSGTLQCYGGVVMYTVY